MPSPNGVSYVHCNVAERLDVHNLIAGAIDEYGRIDVLVNNAGIVSGGDFLEISEEEFDNVMSVNLKGSFLCSQAAAKHMVEHVEAGGEPDWPRLYHDKNARERC